MKRSSRTGVVARHVGCAIFMASVYGGVVAAQSFQGTTPPLPSPQTSANRLSDSLATPNPLTPSVLSPEAQSTLSGKTDDTVPSRRIPAPRAPVEGESKRITPDIWHPDQDPGDDSNAESTSPAAVGGKSQGAPPHIDRGVVGDPRLEPTDNPVQRLNESNEVVDLQGVGANANWQALQPISPITSGKADASQTDKPPQ